MSAKIIKLSNYHRTNVHVPSTEIVFPQLYRLTGYCWKFREEAKDTGSALIRDMSELEPNLELPLKPEYTLSREIERTGSALPQWTAIDRIHPNIDSGWVIIRHHETRAHLDGYMAAHADMKKGLFSNDIGAYSFDFGYFTLLHRPAREGTPDHLLVYEADLGTGDLGLPEYWTKVINHEGIECPSDILMPDDEAKSSLDEIVKFIDEELT